MGRDQRSKAPRLGEQGYAAATGESFWADRQIPKSARQRWAGEAVNCMPKLPAHASPPRRSSPTLTELDTMIAEVEENRDFYRGFLARAEAAGLGLHRGQRPLQQAESRIAQLSRKRDVLLGLNGHGQTKQ